MVLVAMETLVLQIVIDAIYRYRYAAIDEKNTLVPRLLCTLGRPQNTKPGH